LAFPGKIQSNEVGELEKHTNYGKVS
jgi:hypothetical protein